MKLSDRIQRFKESSKENIPSLSLNTVRRIEISDPSYSSVEDIMTLLRTKATQSLENVILEDNMFDIPTSISPSKPPSPASQTSPSIPSEKVNVLLKKLSWQLNDSQEQPEEVIRRIRQRLKRNTGKEDMKLSTDTFHHQNNPGRNSSLRLENLAGICVIPATSVFGMEVTERTQLSPCSVIKQLVMKQFHETSISPRSSEEPTLQSAGKFESRVRSLPTSPDWRKLIEKEILSVRSLINYCVLFV
jgi:hypothetical protein